MTTPIIEVKNITKYYGKVCVIKNLSLNVFPHEVIALIGASGSGKSTLLKCINALEDISSGDIWVNGVRVHDRWIDIDKVRQKTGMVFQQYNLFPRLTALDNITLAPRKVLHYSEADAKDLGMSLLEQVGLSDKADQYPDKLSGGQQQRVAIARALAMSPQVLLLDEITGALDPELVGEVLEIVRSLALGGMTLVLATHEMAFAKEVANRVCFIADGEICEEGPPEKIFTDPEKQTTRNFLKRIIDAGRL